MKNLKINKPIIDTKKQYNVAKELSKGFIKGGTKGAGIAGGINTAFPALIPSFGSMLVGASNDLSTTEKIGIALGLASKPAVEISGLGILAIGAGIGAIIGTGVSVIKYIKYNKIAKEEKKKTLK